MTLKQNVHLECSTEKYRQGVVYGGPMYYLQGLSEKVINFGKVLAIIFAVLCIDGHLRIMLLNQSGGSTNCFCFSTWSSGSAGFS